MDKEKKELLQNMYPDLKGQDFEKLVYFSDQTNLDPLRNQIYSVKRSIKKNNVWIPVYTIQTSIDGFRLIAERTGKYAPGKEPLIVLDEDKNLLSSTAYVKKMTDDKTWHEVAATAYFEEYVQIDKEGKPTRFWKQMPKLMLSKCAESLALRKAFPDSLSELYTDDEMAQADVENKEDIPNDMEKKINEGNKNISDDQYKTLASEISKFPPAKQKDVSDILYNYMDVKSLKDIKTKNYFAAMQCLLKQKIGKKYVK